MNDVSVMLLACYAIWFVIMQVRFRRLRKYVVPNDPRKGVGYVAEMLSVLLFVRGGVKSLPEHGCEERSPAVLEQLERYGRHLRLSLLVGVLLLFAMFVMGLMED